jgi:hypothetical protein
MSPTYILEEKVRTLGLSQVLRAIRPEDLLRQCGSQHITPPLGSVLSRPSQPRLDCRELQRRQSHASRCQESDLQKQQPAEHMVKHGPGQRYSLISEKDWMQIYIEWLC